MKSTLVTKEEIQVRARSLLKQYREAFDAIGQKVEDIERHINGIESLVLTDADFNERDVKLVMGDLNTNQTHLVNILKKMTELHAKMGYIIK